MKNTSEKIAKVYEDGEFTGNYSFKGYVFYVNSKVPVGYHGRYQIRGLNTGASTRAEVIQLINIRTK